MPAAPPVAFATLAAPLPSKPYILGITPTSLSGHLVLDHGSAALTIADNQSLAALDTLEGHSQPITAVRCAEGSVWSAARDATIVRWDERSRREAATIKAVVRKPVPVTALEVCAPDHLVIGGTELASSEAHILFWDMRNTKEPAYRHSSTHSDDITQLSLLPPTGTWAQGPAPLPPRLLLSASTDGCVALSDMRESDEDEALLATENWNQSIAKAGAFAHRGAMRVWARSDMDNLAVWGVGAGAGAEGELQFGEIAETPSDQFKFRDFTTPAVGPNVVLPVGTQRAYPPTLRSEYLIDAAPSLGVGKTGNPMVGVGTNDGNIILQHSAAAGSYAPSAYFVSGPGARGHKDVVRSMYHAVADEAVYTGSEDGVLAGWSLASLPGRLVVGDPAVDDDGGDGREDVDSEDEESEIETESSESEVSDRSDADMDVDDSEEPRYNPVIGRGTDRKEKRKGKRHAPY